MDKLLSVIADTNPNCINKVEEEEEDKINEMISPSFEVKSDNKY